MEEEKKEPKKPNDKDEKPNIIIDKLPDWDIEPPIEIKRGKE